MSNQIKKIVLLAGLPRTGSTLLSNILAQNPAFYVEGNSGLCQIMWDALVSCEVNAREQLVASKRSEDIKKSILGSLPSLYYPQADGKVVLDKCRPWVNQANINMAKSYISPDVKSIVMLRPIDEIVASYARVHFANGGNDDVYDWLLSESNHVLMHSYYACMYAIENRSQNHLFLTYSDIVDSTTMSLKKIYAFIEEDLFVHKTQNFNQVVFEDDETNGMQGMHDIRSTISRKKNNVILPAHIKERCDKLTEELFSALGVMKEVV